MYDFPTEAATDRVNKAHFSSIYSMGNLDFLYTTFKIVGKDRWKQWRSVFRKQNTVYGMCDEK